MLAFISIVTGVAAGFGVNRGFERPKRTADLANNAMGWQWVAGCGTDAAPYFRIFNPVTQSAKFDPDGAFIRRYLPELARVPDTFIHAPWTMPPIDQQLAGCVIGRDYPAPIVDHAQARARTLARFGVVKAAD